jgi:hypothetical protein
MYGRSRNGSARPLSCSDSRPDCGPCSRDPWRCECVRFLGPVVGALLILVGAVWAIQGYGTLKGSFMTGSHVWMWVGIVCVGAGVLILVASLSSIRK